MVKRGRKPPAKKKVVIRLVAQTNPIITHLQPTKRSLAKRDWAFIAHEVLAIFRQYRIENVPVRQMVLTTLTERWNKVAKYRRIVRMTNMRMNRRTQQIRELNRQIDAHLTHRARNEYTLDENLAARAKNKVLTQKLDEIILKEKADKRALITMVTAIRRVLEPIPKPIENALNSAADPVWRHLVRQLILHMAD